MFSRSEHLPKANVLVKQAFAKGKCTQMSNKFGGDILNCHPPIILQ